MKNLVQIKIDSSLSINNDVETKTYLQILKEAINRFDNPESVNINLVNSELIEVSGASGMALHQFSLDCEMLGNKLDYAKQTTFFIS